MSLYIFFNVLIPNYREVIYIRCVLQYISSLMREIPKIISNLAIRIFVMDITLVACIFIILIAVAFVLLFKQFMATYIKLKEKELQLLALKGGSTQKLQAYERMALFLERIKPSYWINNFDKELKPHEFLFLVNKSITEEFDYNASQKLYLSKHSWQNIVNTKDNVLLLIHKTYEKLGENATLEDYKTLLLMGYMNGEDYIAQATEELKKEALILGT